MKKMIAEIQSIIESYLEENEIFNTEYQSVEMRKIFDELAHNLLQKSQVKQIQSQNAVVEAIDKSTGQLYRRYLEIIYEESSTGLLLKGENIAGEDSTIAFLSGQAIEKIYELRGESDVLHNDHCKE